MITFLEEKDFFLGINLSFGSILGLLNSSGFLTLNIKILKLDYFSTLRQPVNSDEPVLTGE